MKDDDFVVNVAHGAEWLELLARCNNSARSGLPLQQLFLELLSRCGNSARSCFAVAATPSKVAVPLQQLLAKLPCRCSATPLEVAVTLPQLHLAV
ncbi:hypothetical protein Y032_0386g444 [Ancylostoma ceylanicum]|uniref:Uncharacterized protein n=1 Tax=Ancylostoma ceylanicum TaxID=53326 RepID=A0A016RTQ5_9BILA|nr:hypothetical protein Y032_0386g444 [Ancylostoma ceylanicum]